MPPQSRHKGESKQGLVITLVFFILMTIGLGVSTYFGFSQEDKKEQNEVKKVYTERDLLKKERDQLRFMHAMYRSYMGEGKGLPNLETLGTLKTQFDQGTLKLSEDDTKILKELEKGNELEKGLGWNGNQPNQTLKDRIEKWKKDYEALAKQSQGFKNDVADANKKKQDAEDQLAKAKEDFKKDLESLTKKSGDEQKQAKTDLDKFRDSVGQLGADNDKKLLAMEQKVKALNDQLKKKDEEKKQLWARVKDQEERLAEVEKKSTVAPASMRTDWQIAYMDRRGTDPYINLGSADKVKPQLTFTIHGVGLDGRPNPQPKGTLEVRNVISDHLSQAHITSVKDANRDPILKGDVIYNPSWNPTIKKHIALAGTMDITGDGRDSLYEFMRNLARQNIVVDAYLDPKDGSVKGEINLRTDYLILGESQAFSETGRGKEGDKAAGDGEGGKKKMQADAAKYNVTIMPLHKYLEMIGYRLPRSVGEGRPSLYNPNLRPDLTPRLGGEKPPEMKPDK